MRYLSLFSGIEAATQAWHSLGWECVAVAEIEPFPCRLLQHYYPHVPNLGDVTKITEEIIANLGRIDIVVFGSPCQDLSVAGKRKGLAGARSNLFFAAVDIARWARDWCGCRFALWENVPGAFSSNEGRDFAAVVDALAGLEPGTTEVPKGKKWGTEGAAIGPDAMVEWSTLDAQWFGVAQRRRRVFALADFGAWADRPPVLLEPESLRGDSAPSRSSGARVAATLTRGAESSGRGGYAGRRQEDDVNIVAGVLAGVEPGAVWRLGADEAAANHCVAHTLRAKHNMAHREDVDTMVAHLLRADGFDASEDGTGRGTLEAAQSKLNRGQGIIERQAVRRLTPRECERLQGFPDDYTAIPKAADGPRYKALGNSKAVPVVRWIGKRIDFVMRWF